MRRRPLDRVVNASTTAGAVVVTAARTRADVSSPASTPCGSRPRSHPARARQAEAPHRAQPRAGRAGTPDERRDLPKRLAKAPAEWIDLEPMISTGRWRAAGAGRGAFSPGTAWMERRSTRWSGRAIARGRRGRPGQGRHLRRAPAICCASGTAARRAARTDRLPYGNKGCRAASWRVWERRDLRAAAGATPSALGQVPIEDLPSHDGIASGLDRALGVLGSHRAPLSPAMHNAALEALGLDLVYLPFEASGIAEFLPLISELRLRGLSVTAPFKESILSHLDRVTTVALRCGAVNTVVKVWNRLEGHNTDVAASVAPLRRWLRRGIADRGPWSRGARALLQGLHGRGRGAVFNQPGARTGPGSTRRSPIPRLVPAASSLRSPDQHDAGGAGTASRQVAAPARGSRRGSTIWSTTRPRLFSCAAPGPAAPRCGAGSTCSWSRARPSSACSRGGARPWP